MNYNFTLNLPKQNFSMKGNLTENELPIINDWFKNNLYKINKNRYYVLNDGPPYANGEIHIGHAFNKILKDFICKFKLLSGYEINFIPGWDCHGLPIEVNVEKSIKLKNENFRTLCRKYAETQIDIQMKSFYRLGVFCDWKNYYETMNKNFEYSIIDSFIKMFEKDYVYLGLKPNYWCFDCKSALAEAEVEYKEKQSISLFFFVKCIIPDFYKNINVGFLVWTTTPWTIPFNKAIALNIKTKYIAVKYNNKAYIIAENVIKNISNKIFKEKYEILHYFKEYQLKNIIAYHPIYKEKIKVIFSDHVKDDSGTGCVHIAPAYGDEDYKLGIKYNLNIFNNITENGFFDNNVKFFENIYYSDSNEKIINFLNNEKNLVYQEIIYHRYPFCWRHKSQLIFRTTNQWFLNVNNKIFKNKFIYFIKNFIKWIPDSGYLKMKNMMTNRLDWCLSRQRFWGTPIFFFIDNNNKLHPNTINILKKSLNIIKNHGTEFWYSKNVYKIFNIDNNIYKKVNDILDVWFDSSCVYKYLHDKYNINIPFDICVEGSDQYRGWFQASLINSILIFDNIPYKKIMTHGFILDKDGKKMSKSLKNIITPSDIINKFGADVLRLWVASSNYISDINISDEIIDRICDSYRKIRNTFKFFISNINDINKNTFYIKNLLKIDLWILEKFFILKNEILNNYFSFNFHTAYQKLYTYCINDLCSKYIDIIKDRLYTMHKFNDCRKSSQSIIFYIIYNLLKIFSPILSFTTNEAWHFLKFKDNNFIFNSYFNIDFFIFNKLKKNDIYNNLLWDKLFNIKSEVNKSFEHEKNIQKINTLLETIIIFYCNIYWNYLLIKIKNELNIFFQSSNIKIFFRRYILKIKSNNGLFFKIKKIKTNKCERCWLRYKSVKLKICSKCILNIYYNDFIKYFV